MADVVVTDADREAANAYAAEQRMGFLNDGHPLIFAFARHRIAARKQALDEAATPAARDVLAERERQKSVEGWTPEHDDEHEYAELARAAACYAYGEMIDTQTGYSLWPWGESWWKPEDARRNLVKAGALILAEIERLDRAIGDKE